MKTVTNEAMTLTQAAEYTGRSVFTIRRWTKDGAAGKTLPYSRDGNRILVSRLDLDRFINQMSRAAENRRGVLTHKPRQKRTAAAPAPSASEMEEKRKKLAKAMQNL